MQRQRLPGERLADRLVARVGVALEQVGGGDDQARRAEAALHRAGVEERLLHRVQRAAVGERLDRAARPRRRPARRGRGRSRRRRRRARPSTSRTRPARRRSSSRRARARRAGTSAGSSPGQASASRSSPFDGRADLTLQPSGRRASRERPPREHLDRVPPVGGRAADVVDRCAAAAASRPNSATASSGRAAVRLVPRDGAGGERLRLGRADDRRRRRSRARAGRLRAAASSWRQTPGDGDHHRVARPDLRERAGRVDALPLDADDQLVRRERRPLRAGEELVPRAPTARRPREATTTSRRTRRARGCCRPRARPWRGCRRSSRGSGSAASRPSATPRRAGGTPRAPSRCARTSRPRRAGRGRRRRSTSSARRPATGRAAPAARAGPKLTATIRSVPPATGTASGCAAFSASASSSERGTKRLHHTVTVANASIIAGTSSPSG